MEKKLSAPPSKKVDELQDFGLNSLKMSKNKTSPQEEATSGSVIEFGDQKVVKRSKTIVARDLKVKEYANKKNRELAFL